MTELQLEFIRKFSPDNSPVQWHDVFARLKEMRYLMTAGYGQITFYLHPYDTKDEIIVCDLTLSPMEQHELIEQLLLLSN